MSTPKKLYVFGDQTYDVQPRELRTLLHARDDPTVTAFLERAHAGLRADMHAQLTGEERDRLPRFSSVADLAAWREPVRGRCLALDTAMMCIYQLGTFMRQVHQTPYPTPSETHLLGLCTGALTAAAISCSTTPQDLLTPALQTVRAAFRVGKLVEDMAKRLDSPSSSESDPPPPPESWSLLLSDTNAEKLVQKFSSQQTKGNASFFARPWISAYTPTGATVSGPPGCLAALSASEECAGVRARKLPIYAPYHAPHLFTREHVRSVVQDIDVNTVGTVKMTMLSGSTGETIGGGSKGGSSTSSTSFAEVLEAAVEQVLMQPIRWNLVLERLRKEEKGRDLEVIPIATVADQLILTALKKQKQQKGPHRPAPNAPNVPKIAIIGVSGRFPGADDTEALWNTLYAGLDTCKEVPLTRWDITTHCDDSFPKHKNTSAARHGCFLDTAALFDAPFFDVSAAEARAMDPAQRLALLTTYEALEQAGLVCGATASTRGDRVGVFYGVGGSDWKECNAAQDVDKYLIPGASPAFLAGRISAAFRFGGASYVVNTGGSSSLAAVHLACGALARGEVDACVAGGVNVMTNPDMHAGLDRCQLLSHTGNCKPFDSSADGYCRAEGVASLVMKRLDDALAEGDSILGVISGTHTNHHAENRRDVYTQVLEKAAVDASSVGYIEMSSSTCTAADDAREMDTLLDVFAPPPPRSSYRAQPLYVGSAKGTIGHGEAASGVCGLVKALLMLRENSIPPHVGITTRINSGFPADLEKRNIRVATKGAMAWPRAGAEPRRVLVSNFSMTGGNTALLLEDAPVERSGEDLVRANGNGVRTTTTHHIVTVSAKSPTALRGNLRALNLWLQKNPNVSLAQLSYTTTARRMHHPYRAMLIGSAIHNLYPQIQDAMNEIENLATQAIAPQKKVLFAFTDAGQDLFTHAHELMDRFSQFRHDVQQLDHMVTCLGQPSIEPLLRGQQQRDNTSNESAHLASICVQIALAKLWRSWGIVPRAVVSQTGNKSNISGEYAALNAAGVLSDADTIALVVARARLLAAETKHRQKVMAEFTNLARNTKSRKPCVPVFLVESSDKVVGSDAIDETYLVRSADRHTTNAVEMSHEDLLNACRQYDEEVITDQSIALEMSPLPTVLKSPSSATDTDDIPNGLNGHMGSKTRNVDLWDSLADTLQTLYCAGVDIHWAQYQRDSDPSSRKVVTNLPAYSWDLEEYWIPYVRDWTLRKGDPPLVVTGRKLETTTIHNVLEETESPGRDKVVVVVECDISRSDLHGMVQGHVVDGVPLCTPSVYSDIALSVGEYLLERYRPDNPQKQLAISDMGVTKALIPLPISPQMMQTRIEADWNTNSATCKFVTFDKKGNPQEHAHCEILFTDTSLQDQLTLFDSASTYTRLIQRLRADVATEKTERFTRNMMYRMIRSLAEFHPDHKLVDDIVLDSSTHEATARVSFGTLTTRDSVFHTHPAVVDALTQPGGFSLNGADGTDLDREVYINHGWKCFHLFERFDLDKVYTVYTHMTKSEDEERIFAGDIVVLDGDKIVALFEQYSVQMLPRRTLRILLHAEGGSAYKAQLNGNGNAGHKPPSLVPAVQAQGTQRPSPTIQTPRLQIPEKTNAKSPATKDTSAITLDSSSSGNGFTSSPDTTYSDRPWTIQVPQATSVILQGTAKAPKKLFLFPDGSGSATSYASIPHISPDVCVIGLNSPFLKDPIAMNACPLDALMDQGYLPELHRRQAEGPYYIGGWSAGGTYAYSAAQKLMRAGHRIAGLVLIDAPPPLRGMDPLPAHLYEYIERKGAFGGWSGMGKRPTPEWLIPHFNATIKVLQFYCAAPFEASQCEGLTVACVWAAESVVEPQGALPPHPDDTEGMKFLTIRRTDFSAAGWEKLFPGPAKVVCDKIEGAHHFSLTRQPYVTKLADFIRRVM